MGKKNKPPKIDYLSQPIVPKNLPTPYIGMPTSPLPPLIAQNFWAMQAMTDPITGQQMQVPQFQIPWWNDVQAAALLPQPPAPPPAPPAPPAPSGTPNVNDNTAALAAILGNGFGEPARLPMVPWGLPTTHLQ